MKKDVEKVYSSKRFIEKIRRLADALEKNEKCTFQVAGRKVVIPKDVSVSIEYESEGSEQELDLQIKWKKK